VTLHCCSVSVHLVQKSAVGNPFPWQQQKVFKELFVDFPLCEYKFIYICVCVCVYAAVNTELCACLPTLAQFVGRPLCQHVPLLLSSPAKEQRRTWDQVCSRTFSFKLIDSTVGLLQNFHSGVSSFPGSLDLVTT